MGTGKFAMSTREIFCGHLTTNPGTGWHGQGSMGAYRPTCGAATIARTSVHGQPIKRTRAVKDNVPSDIWVAEPDNDGDGKRDGVHLFASLKDNGAEGSGIYFGND